MTLYRTILADPPWKQTLTSGGLYKSARNRRPKRLPYPHMTLEAIKALPVAELADEACHLWLWTTNEFLREGFAVMEAWGFKYLAPITWKKPSGCGNYFIHRTQTLLFGYYGKCRFPLARYVPTDYDWPCPECEQGPIDLLQEWPAPRRHSRKPEQSYDLIESVSEGPRLELFARPVSALFPKRPGWDVWGNEVESDVELVTPSPFVGHVQMSR